jgi:lysophospholipid acyltransferase (LPLAT)-like uncharacterized protein
MRWKGAPQLVDRLAWALTSTWTYHIFGSEHIRAACQASPTGHVMLVLWHQDLLQLTGCIRGQGMHLAALVSRSGDGALIAVHLERRGVRTIRGSSHRGAAAAAKELLSAAQDGFHPAIAIDGPKGPARQTRNGPLEIARLAGLPIVPLAARATHDIRLPTWDRLRIPLPRAHVAMLIGEPIYPPPTAPSAEVLEQRRRQLAITLNELSARAADHAGQSDRFPAARHLDWLEEPPRSAIPGKKSLS